MGSVRELSEKLWSGEASTADLHPFTTLLGLEEWSEGLAFVSSFANVVVLDTSEGLVLIDTGSFVTAQAVRSAVQGFSDRPVHTAVYTHGHVDHVMGIAAFETGGHRARVVAHEAVPARFDRYKLTAGYNGFVNARQFRMPGLTWPTDYRYPDETYARELELTVGGERLSLRHARGETDDHTWVWLPERRVLCTGDLFIWASPNCGNPQKVQRYPREWAEALRTMAALDAQTLFPGHGPPIEGAERVRQALTETAELLETLHDQTVARMNAGDPLDAVLAAVKAPDHLLARPYLRPVYDEPEFVVRNLWRLYGGWWDGNPAHLKPAREARLAAEVAALAGGAGKLAERAKALGDAGEHALACHLAEWAGRAAPDDGAVEAIRAEIYRRRARAETSLMARGVFETAAEEKPR